jgi:polar amino acid transport system substrate-binding protein
MKRHTFAALTILAVAGLVLTACAPAGGGSAARPKIKVATDATWPPFEMVDEATKEIVGFDIDLIKAIGAKGGFDVEMVNVAFDPLLAGVAQCQYDAAISAITITDERSKNMAFSDQYFAAGQIVTVAKDNADITGKDTLSGKRVGAQLGTTGAMEAEKMQGATAKIYDTIDLAFQDLINGQVDAVIADNPLALGFVGKNPDKLKTVGEAFTSEFYGVAVCNKKADLLAMINKGLAEVKKDGTLDQLTAKWVSGGGK